MPQLPRIPLWFLVLDPFITTMIRIRDSVCLALLILDRWILALIVHHEIAWAICAITMAIGEGITASWRPKMEETSDDKGYRAFIAATLAVFWLWSCILFLIIICEFMGFLIWVWIYFVAVRFGLRPPRLLPLVERAWLLMGYDLVSLWRTHYR